MGFGSPVTDANAATSASVNTRVVENVAPTETRGASDSEGEALAESAPRANAFEANARACVDGRAAATADATRSMRVVSRRFRTRGRTRRGARVCGGLGDCRVLFGERKKNEQRKRKKERGTNG